MRIISARMSAIYQGRIDAELSTCDAVLLIRDGDSGDGSVVLMSAASGVLPKNWMPAGTTCKETKGGFVFECKNERLEVFLYQIYFDQEAPDEIDGTLAKIGSEKEVADHLSQNLKILGEDLELIEREYRTQAGPLDILVKDKDGLVVVEVKRRKATSADLYQIQRYLDAVEEGSRAILVAPSTTRGLIEEMDLKGIRFVRFSIRDIV